VLLGERGGEPTWLVIDPKILVDAAGFDEARARDWVIVRSILDAHGAFADSVRAARALTAEEQDYVTRCITIAKAVQD
jgi:streptomycin 6-kinase